MNQDCNICNYADRRSKNDVWRMKSRIYNSIIITLALNTTNIALQSIDLCIVSCTR